MSNQIVDATRKAGVVGAGGGGFPTHVKVSSSVEIAVANGAECEPLLKVDQHIMAAKAGAVVEGLSLVMQATGARKGIVALKAEYKKAVEAIRAAASRYPNVSVHLIGSYYPAGDEFVLVYETTGRLVPEGGLPLHVGVVVQNVCTLVNIAEAMQGQAVTHRYVTVTGEVYSPKTLRLPVGTSLAQAIRLAGGIKVAQGRTGSDYAVVLGGPMMGRLASDLDAPVTKTLGGIIVLPKDNAVVRRMSESLRTSLRRGKSTCDQCRDCTDLCPRSLLGHRLFPHEIMRSLNYASSEPTDNITSAVLCCECRLCEAYACPLELSPMAYYKAVKRNLEASGWVNTRHRRSDLKVHDMFDGRRVPTHRLMDKLGLTRYRDLPVPLDESPVRPGRVTIPLKQHTGVAAQPTVKQGDKVRPGDLIGQVPEGKLGADVHASIRGTVREVVEGRQVVIEE